MKHLSPFLLPPNEGQWSGGAVRSPRELVSALTWKALCVVSQSCSPQSIQCCHPFCSFCCAFIIFPFLSQYSYHCLLMVLFFTLLSVRVQLRILLNADIKVWNTLIKPGASLKMARVLRESSQNSLLGFHTLLILCFFPVFALGPWVACGKVALFFLKTEQIWKEGSLYIN